MDSIQCKYSGGQRVADIITDYTGTITAVCHCFDRNLTQYLVERADALGRPIEQWVDEQRITTAEQEAPNNNGSI